MNLAFSPRLSVYENTRRISLDIDSIAALALPITQEKSLPAGNALV